MKKLTSFIIALIVFAVIIISIHFVAAATVPKNDRDFGMWISSFKDSSYKVISNNITDKTVLYMGSSEFHHGLNHKYNPTNYFRDSSVDVMCIGGAYNQCLTHSVAVGALGKELENKKVCLILSPTWFYENVKMESSKFLLRFSKEQYDEAMKNPILTPETKKQMQENIKAIGKDIISNESKDGFFQRILKREKDIVRTASMWNLEKKKMKKNHKAAGPIDFEKFYADADKAEKKKCTNEFNMEDKFFERKFKPRLSAMENKNRNNSFEKSAEYDNLRLFLDVCREQNLEVLLILQPMNGKWYDYTGFPEEKRNVVSDKIEEIAKEKGVKLCNLFDQSYTEGFFEDAVHPSEKGWVIINENAYKFFNQNNS